MNPHITDAQDLERQRIIATKILTKLNAVKITGRVALAIEMIATRLIHTGNSLSLLYNNSSMADFRFDAASLLRTAYDAMLQGLYIMKEPQDREERAGLFLDFIYVEKVEWFKLYDGNPTDLAKFVSQSPKRRDAEPEIRKRFDEVKDQFMTKKGKLQENWYPGKPYDLAKETGYESEYKLMQKILSGVVHSTPRTLQEGPWMSEYMLLSWYWQFTFRILGAYADFKGIELNEDEKESIADAQENALNFH